MSPRPIQPPPDLTDDWPDDPDNQDLARLATDLVAARRELPAISLDRIQVRLRQEIIRVDRRRKWLTIAGVFAVTIAAFIGLRTYLAAPSTPNKTDDASSPHDPPLVQDRFQITLPPSTPKAPDRPLIDLSPNSPLFGDPATPPPNKP